MDSVKVTYFDSARVRRALDDYVRELTAHDPLIDQIVLFGSLVAETAVPGSDVDLLIVLSGSDRPFHDRIPLFLPSDFPVGMDVFPYTREELERMKRDANPFVLGALRDGLTLYKKSHAS